MSPRSSTATVDGRRARFSRLGLLERGGLPLFLVAMIVFFASIPKTSHIFVSQGNIGQILSNQSVTGVIALAMIIPLAAGYFDLSVAATAGLANLTMITVIATDGKPIIVGILAGMAVATAIGALNGFLVATLKLNALVVTLGSYTLIGGLVQWFSKGQTIVNGVPPSFFSWSQGKWLGLPKPFVTLMLIALLVWYLLMHTPHGRKLESIGSNAVAARLVGIRVGAVVFVSFLASGFMAGVAGVLLSVTAGTADPMAGPAYLFPALAAVFIGTTSIRPGHYNVWGTIFGVFVVAVAVSGLTLMGAQTWVTPVFNGAALVIAVTISTLMGRRRDDHARKSRMRAHEDPVPVVVDAEPRGATPVSSTPSASR